jgi:hypothetical protein
MPVQRRVAQASGTATASDCRPHHPPRPGNGARPDPLALRRRRRTRRRAGQQHLRGTPQRPRSRRAGTPARLGHRQRHCGPAAQRGRAPHWHQPDLRRRLGRPGPPCLPDPARRAARFWHQTHNHRHHPHQSPAATTAAGALPHLDVGNTSAAFIGIFSDAQHARCHKNSYYGSSAGQLSIAPRRVPPRRGETGTEVAARTAIRRQSAASTPPARSGWVN